jgi:hypothetical protein
LLEKRSAEYHNTYRCRRNTAASSLGLLLMMILNMSGLLGAMVGLMFRRNLLRKITALERAGTQPKFSLSEIAFEGSALLNFQPLLFGFQMALELHSAVTRYFFVCEKTPVSLQVLCTIWLADERKQSGLGHWQRLSAEQTTQPPISLFRDGGPHHISVVLSRNCLKWTICNCFGMKSRRWKCVALSQGCLAT